MHGFRWSNNQNMYINSMQASAGKHLLRCNGKTERENCCKRGESFHSNPPLESLLLQEILAGVPVVVSQRTKECLHGCQSSCHKGHINVYPAADIAVRVVHHRHTGTSAVLSF